MTLWYPRAIRRDGPAGRVSGPRTPKYGAIYHSMVGKVRPAQTGHSWQFSVFKNGTVEQHYPVTAWCWHSGDRDDPAGDITNNRDLFGIEHEGGPIGNESEPLTARQLAATIDLTAWAIAEGHISNLSRSGDRRGLWEHNEIPEASTACPSNRIPWGVIIERATKEEDSMAALFKVSGRGSKVWVHSGASIHRVESGAALTRLRKLKAVPDTPAPTISEAEFKRLKEDLDIE